MHHRHPIATVIVTVVTVIVIVIVIIVIIVSAVIGRHWPASMSVRHHHLSHSRKTLCRPGGVPCDDVGLGRSNGLSLVQLGRARSDLRELRQ